MPLKIRANTAEKIHNKNNSLISKKVHDTDIRLFYLESHLINYQLKREGPFFYINIRYIIKNLSSNCIVLVYERQ